MRTLQQVSRPLLTADPTFSIEDAPWQTSKSQREDKDQQLLPQRRPQLQQQQQQRVDMYRREPYRQTDRAFYMTLRQKPVR